MDLWNSTTHFLASQFSWSSFKACLAAGLVWFWAQVSMAAGLAHPSIPSLVALVTLDFALASYVALREDRFTRQGFWHGMGKYLSYSLIFIVTGIADNGIGITDFPVNLTVGMSCWGIAGEAISCLGHIDHIFPGRIPPWIFVRLRTFRASIERNASGYDRRKEDWRGYWRAEEGANEQALEQCRGRIPEDEE